MALLTDEQTREIKGLVQEVLDAMDVEIATLNVIKRRLEGALISADAVLDRP
ncbi:MAG: hypothetical protein OK436_07280 [Thaumarchaeota archaeon]|nr:hypothetical protein [Nitrososphaerota archaeon]